MFSSPSVFSPMCLCVAVAAFATATGCNSSKFEFANVEGQVSLDGKPVNQAKVVFMPSKPTANGESGPFSQGVTDAEGRFVLQTVERSPRAGAVVGPHRIIVSTKRARLDPDGLDREIIEVPESIPWEYTYYKRSPLRFDVPSGGTKSAALKLETPVQ